MSREQRLDLLYKLVVTYVVVCAASSFSVKAAGCKGWSINVCSPQSETHWNLFVVRSSSWKNASDVVQMTKNEKKETKKKTKRKKRNEYHAMVRIAPYRGDIVLSRLSVKSIPFYSNFLNILLHPCFRYFLITANAKAYENTSLKIASVVAIDQASWKNVSPSF